MPIVSTNVDDFLGELSAGILKEKLGHILSKAAEGCTVHGKKASVGMVFSMSPIGEDGQVIMSVKLSNTVPTKRGKSTEEDTTDTPMFVGKGGEITIDQPREEESGQFALADKKKQPLNNVEQINQG